MFEESFPAVYAISCLSNGKFYIGSTNNFARRSYHHLRNLRLGCHSNPRLQSSASRHGLESLVFSVLHSCSVEDLLGTEQEYLNLFFGSPLCVNDNPVASKPPNRKGVPLSESHKQKISEAHKRSGHKPIGWAGKKRSKETRDKISSSLKRLGVKPPSRKGVKDSLATRLKKGNSHKKPVTQYDMDGNFIANWPSATDAARAMGRKSSSSIGECCNHNKTHAYGYVWKFTHGP